MSGLNLAGAAGSRILRRHTTYVKGSAADLSASASASASSGERPAVHVHSWHRRNVKKKVRNFF